MDEKRAAEIAAWTERLQQTFRGPTGISGDRLLELESIEKDHRFKLVSQSAGYATLMDAFLDFYLQTQQEAWAHDPPPTPTAVGIFLATFWRFRSGYIIFWNGYYFDAAAHLRSVFENILYYGAVLNGYLTETSLFDISGFDNSLPWSKMERLAFEHQQRIAKLVKSKMIGLDSGLSQSDQDGLRTFLGLLHSHVHRAESNVISIMMEGAKGMPISLIPPVDPEKASIFMNTSVWAGWALTRLLPFLSKPHLFSESWHGRYRVLDDSFAQYLGSFEKEGGRIFERFIQLKMSFDF